MYCPNCGTQNQDAAAKCVACGALIQPLPPRPLSIDEDPAMRILLPVGRSLWAIAAGYAGLFAIIPLFAPIALVLGILAIGHLKRNPKLHGIGRAVLGLVMGAIGTLLLAFFVVAILAAPH
jgi:hypothetical protein